MLRSIQEQFFDFLVIRCKRVKDQQNQQSKTHINIIYKQAIKGKAQLSTVMSQISSHRRHRSQFQKGMTLEQYLRGMEVTQDTVPTADSAFGHSRQKQQCLYKTSHQFYVPAEKPNHGYIRQISQQNYEESLDQFRDNINIVSSQLHPAYKKTPKQVAIVEDLKKTYRIRNGKSNSPYNHQAFKLENKKTLSPYKPAFKKNDGFAYENIIKNEQKNLKDSNKIGMVKTFYGNQFQIRKSTKNIKFAQFEDQQVNKGQKYPSFFHKQLQHKQQKQLIENFDIDMGKVDIRVENIKERLQIKRKYKNKL